jgi:ribose transport system substrate-binding protein
MKRRTTATWMALLAVLALVAAACGGGDGDGDGEAAGAQQTEAAAPEETAAADGATEQAAADGEAIAITIGWTPPDITGVFRTATDFFEESAAQANEHGFDVTVLSRSPATHTAFGDQLAIIEDYVSQGVDAIAISPADTEAIKPGIRAANDAGIPVIMVNLLSEQEGIDIAAYIGFDNEEAATVTAYSVADYFGGPGVLGEGEQVEPPEDGQLDLEWWQQTYDSQGISPDADGVIIEGIAGTFFSNTRLRGFNGVVDQFDELTIIAEPIAADWNREQGISAAETFLSRFDPAPDGELQFIWAASGEMAIGAQIAAERANVLDDSGGESPRPEGTVSIFSNDVTPESVELIREGKIIAETHHGFAEWGWFGTEFGVKVACGIDVPQFQDINPRTAWQGNADRFYPDPALPEIDWEQIRADCEPPQ